MKRKIYLVSILAALSIGVILILYLQAVSAIQYPNRFSRKFHLTPIQLFKSVDIKTNSYYIAGVNSDCVYLGNETLPLSILVYDIESGQTSSLRIKNLDVKNIRSGRLSVDSSYFLLTDRIGQTDFIGTVNGFVVSKIIHDRFTTDLKVPMDSNSFAIRAFKNHGLDYTLGKESISPNRVKLASEVLEKRADGIFYNDGMLNYDRMNHKLVYLYFYRNQYIVLDTNLNTLFRAKTVDTTNNPQLKTATIKSESTFTLAEPPKIINQSSYAFNNNLFIHSTLKADNESPASFKRSSVIDVYDMDKGIYKYSFYVAKYRGNKIKNFAIGSGYLVTVSGHYLLLYKYDVK